MRVITGSARGRVLQPVAGMDVRPTTDKVKEAVFSAIQFEVEGARVLDLFCGSGQMGIEALSRGAQSCVFVDASRASQNVTKKNLTTTGLMSKARVAAMDYELFLKSTKDQFDLVFLDPPYSKGFVQKALPLIAPHVSESGVILCEHERCDPPPLSFGGFVRTKEYRYGRISISAFRRQEQKEEAPV